MVRLGWSQLRFQSGRALALLAGMLVATTAFTVLTAAARAAQVRTIGTVNAHFHPSCDILVRPSGARSSLKLATGTVQPNFLSGIYGGITAGQWRQIERIPGRTLVGALSLAVGVTALTLLVAVNLAFRGAVRGALLGDFVTVQVRGVDYVAVAATVVLGVLAIADALLISITERAPELATSAPSAGPAAVFAGKLPPLLPAHLLRRLPAAPLLAQE